MIQLLLKGFHPSTIVWSGSTLHSVYTIKRFLHTTLKCPIDSIQLYHHNQPLSDDKPIYLYPHIQSNSELTFTHQVKAGLDFFPTITLFCALLVTGAFFFFLFTGCIPMVSHVFFEAFGDVASSLWNGLVHILHMESNRIIYWISYLGTLILSLLKVLGAFPFVYVIAGFAAFCWYSFAQLQKNTYDYCDCLLKSNQVGKITAFIFIGIYLLFQLPNYALSFMASVGTLFVGKTNVDLFFDPILKNVNNAIQYVYSALFYPIPIYGQLLLVYHLGVTFVGNGIFDLSNTVNKYMLKLQGIYRKVEDYQLKAQALMRKAEALKEQAQEKIAGVDVGAIGEKAGPLSGQVSEHAEQMKAALQEQLNAMELTKAKEKLDHILGADFKDLFMKQIKKMEVIAKKLSEGNQEEMLKIIHGGKELTNKFISMVSKPIEFLLNSPLQAELAKYDLINPLMMVYVATNPKYRKLIRRIVEYNDYLESPAPIGADGQPVEKRLFYDYVRDIDDTSVACYQLPVPDTVEIPFTKKIRNFFKLIWFGDSTKNRSYTYPELLTLCATSEKKALAYAKSMYRYQYAASFLDPCEVPDGFLYLIMSFYIFIGNTVYNVIQGTANIQEAITEYGGLNEVINQIKIVSSTSIIVVISFIVLLIVYASK
jgi:hypothetical protein